MFLKSLINQGNIPVLEQVASFTAARHRLLLENAANVSTPNYRQKDFDVAGFQQALRERIASRAGRPPGSVRFDDLMQDSTHPVRNVLFHDRNNRSVEQLNADVAQNAMMYNMAIELLRRQFSSLDQAIRERVS